MYSRSTKNQIALRLTTSEGRNMDRSQLRHIFADQLAQKSSSNLNAAAITW